MILLPLVAATLGAGCTTFTDDNAAMRVDDVSYSHDDLAEIAAVFGLPEELETSLTDLRSIATSIVNITAIGNYLEEQGVVLTEADLTAATTQMATSPSFGEASADIQSALVNAQAYFSLLSSTDDPAQTQFEALENADIYVDPQIGTYEIEFFEIVPLG